MNPQPGLEQAASFFNQQGASFQAQQPQQSTPQPISRLANPTSYHLHQTQLRNQKQNSNDGAPPTPSNSYQSNTLSNSFSNSTIDPQILNLSQLQHHYINNNNNPIKQETDSPEINQDMDYDTSNSVLSPLSNTPLGSPPNHHDGFEVDTFGKSFKPASHLESHSPYGESPGNTSIISYGAENVDYYGDEISEFSPMSAPTTTSPIGPMDVKSNMKFVKQPYNSFGTQISMNSMSLPVQYSNDGWFGGSLDGSNNFPTGAHPSSLQYPGENMQLLATSGFLDSDDADTAQKQAMLFEKRRRRRESHNAVERRRRDNINEKIQELSTLLPDLYIDSANKPNKGAILRKSVDYIRHLKQIVEQQQSRNVELESKFRELASKSASPMDNNSNSASSIMDSSSIGGGLSGSPHTSSLDVMENLGTRFVM